MMIVIVMTMITQYNNDSDDDATQCNAMQRSAVQRNAMQRNDNDNANAIDHGKR